MVVVVVADVNSYVVIHAGGNQEPFEKPLALDGRPLACHMPGFEPGSQRWHASV